MNRFQGKNCSKCRIAACGPLRRYFGSEYLGRGLLLSVRLHQQSVKIYRIMTTTGYLSFSTKLKWAAPVRNWSAQARGRDYRSSVRLNSWLSCSAKAHFLLLSPTPLGFPASSQIFLSGISSFWLPQATATMTGMFIKLRYNPASPFMPNFNHWRCDPCVGLRAFPRSIVNWDSHNWECWPIIDDGRCPQECWCLLLHLRL